MSSGSTLRDAIGASDLWRNFDRLLFEIATLVALGYSVLRNKEWRDEERL